MSLPDLLCPIKNRPKNRLFWATESVELLLGCFHNWWNCSWSTNNAAPPGVFPKLLTICHPQLSEMIRPWSFFFHFTLIYGKSQNRVKSVEDYGSLQSENTMNASIPFYPHEMQLLFLTLYKYENCRGRARSSFNRRCHAIFFWLKKEIYQDLWML